MRQVQIMAAAALLTFAFQHQSLAQPAATAADLIELDFEELVNMEVEIQSAGKHLTRAMDLPYAAFVISAQDIANSGALTIPDALRLAPGVAVRQISAGEWAIGIRGAGGLFSRLVLVLIDGKIAYNSVFSGVNWDEINITMGQIERIEVIRGPNASAWGANAVNGIINIITHTPSSDANQHLKTWAGSGDRAGFSTRKSTSLAGNWNASLSGHYTQWEGLKNPETQANENGHNDWRASIGLEHNSETSNTTFSTEAFGSTLSPHWSWFDEETRTEVVAEKVEEKTGWSFQAEHQSEFKPGKFLKLHFSTDNTLRENTLYDWDSRVYQLDAELVAQWQSHTLSGGINARSSYSSAIMKPHFDLDFSPEEREVNSLGIYLSDTMTLHERFQLTLSARLDESDLSKQNLQPSIRGLWQSSNRGRFWAAYSEANTTPSRALVDINEVPYVVLEPDASGPPLPVLLYLSGYPEQMDDTRLKAIEVGYRHTFEHFNIDIALFDFRYSNEVTVALNGDPYMQFDDNYNPTHLVQHANFVNAKSFSSQGGELSMRGQFTPGWTYQLAYSIVQTKDDFSGSSQSASLLNSVALNNALTWNITIRYRESPAETDAAFSQYADPLGEIDTYLTADTNLAWNFRPRWQLDFIVNNIGSEHTEGVREEFGTDVLTVETFAVVQASYRL